VKTALVSEEFASGLSHRGCLLKRKFRPSAAPRPAPALSGARLAPKSTATHKPRRQGDQGPNFQPAIMITVDGQPRDEFASTAGIRRRRLAFLLDGNGDIVRRALSREFRCRRGP